MIRLKAPSLDPARLVVVLLCAQILAPDAAWSDNWGRIAAISSTMGVNANRLCVGEATRSDIGCPDYAPSVTTAGLEVSGTVNATRFLGDGSGLTGIAANVSVTTGASGSIVFRDAYGSLRASSGLSISSTTGSVGIGTGPSNVGNNGLYVVGATYTGGNATVNGALYSGGLFTANSNATVNGTLYSGGLFTANSGLLATTGSIAVASGPVLTISNGVPLVRVTSGFTDPSLSISGGANMPEALRIVSTGYVGIGTANPSSSLHIVASTAQLSISSTSGEAKVLISGRPWSFVDLMSSNAINAVRFGNPSTIQWSVGNAGSSDLLFSAGGSLPSNGAPNLKLKSNGTIGIGTATPTTALEVSGTVSATAFVGDGSGLTGIAANTSVTTGASGSLVFRDAYGGLMASSGLSISSTTGSVGIGAGAPAYLGNNGLYTQGSVYANGNSYANGTFGLGGSNLGMSGNGPSQYLTFLTSNTEAMRIVSTGYVGIGTANPASALDVSGSVRGFGLTADDPNSGLPKWTSANLSLNLLLSGGRQPAIGFYPASAYTATVSPVAIYNGQTGFFIARAPTAGNSGTAINTLVAVSTTSGNVGIGTSAPGAKLEVMGTISATALVINGQAVTGGAGSFASLTDVSYSSVGGNIFGPGSLAGANSNVTDSTVFGYGALSSANNSGGGNTALGAGALAGNSTGSLNTAIGRRALNANTSGFQNIAIGPSALISNTSGRQNVAIGPYSLYNTTTGASNIAVGWNAGAGITTGSSNTVIGINISPYSNTGSNQLAIANAIWGDTGNGDTLRAKIGINATSPTTALEVSGTVSATRFIGDGSGLTGIAAAANDNITSGTGYVKALQNVGAFVSGSLAISGSLAVGADSAISGTLKLSSSNDHPGGCNSLADHGKLKWENDILYLCK